MYYPQCITCNVIPQCITRNVLPAMYYSQCSLLSLVKTILAAHEPRSLCEDPIGCEHTILNKSMSVWIAWSNRMCFQRASACFSQFSTTQGPLMCATCRAVPRVYRHYPRRLYIQSTSHKEMRFSGSFLVCSDGGPGLIPSSEWLFIPTQAHTQGL